jgi:hypothetical protein
VAIPVFKTLPEKLYRIWLPLTIDEPVHALVTLIEQKGNETGVVKSLKLAFTDVDERVSEKKVLKQGRLAPKI